MLQRIRAAAIDWTAPCLTATHDGSTVAPTPQFFQDHLLNIAVFLSRQGRNSLGSLRLMINIGHGS